MIIQSYNDLIHEIDCMQLRIDGMKDEIKYWSRLMHQNAPKELNGMSYDGMPKGSPNYMSLDRILENIRHLESHIFLYEEALKVKQQSRQAIEEILKSMEGLEYKVFYMHNIKGMLLKEIADVLGYSQDHVRRVSSKLPREA